MTLVMSPYLQFTIIRDYTVPLRMTLVISRCLQFTIIRDFRVPLRMTLVMSPCLQFTKIRDFRVPLRITLVMSPCLQFTIIRDFRVPLRMTFVRTAHFKFTIIRVYVWSESAILRSIFVQLRESTQLVEYLRHGGTCCRRQRVSSVTGRRVDACAQQYDDQRAGYDVDAAHVVRRAYGRLQQNQRCMQCMIT